MLRLFLFTLAALLCIPAIYGLLLLIYTRVDTLEEFDIKRIAAFVNVFIWPVIVGLFKLSRPPKDFNGSTTWLSQMFGERGAVIVEASILILLTFCGAWFISTGAMQGEYKRMLEPNYDWLYRIMGI